MENTKTSVNPQDLAFELAKSEGFEEVELYRRPSWHGYLVFIAIKEYKRDWSDFPDYLPLILVKGGKARWAGENEAESITIKCL